MALNKVGDAKYIALETFKKNGEGVNTPVWVTKKDGKLYVITDETSWKIKRIRNNRQVRIAPSDVRGNPTGEWLEAEATILVDEEAVVQQRKRLSKKYALGYFLISLSYRFRRVKRQDVVIEIQS